MTNNFDLRKFLSENKLTKAYNTVDEGQADKGKTARTHVVYAANVEYKDDDNRSILYPSFRVTVKKGEDAEQRAIDLIKKHFGDSFSKIKAISKAQNPESSNMKEPLEEVVENIHPLIFDIDYYYNEIIPNLLNKGYIEDEEADDLYTLVRTYKQAVNKNSIDEEVSEEIQEEKVEEVKEETVNESREAYLTKLVENALGITPAPVAEEANEEMVEENPLPKYKNIDELMKNIEYGTNEAAHKYKMNRMKEIADALEAKVTSLEEGENAEHIDQKAVKAMKKDIMTLRKGVDKLEKEYEKKFAKKEVKKEVK